MELELDFYKRINSNIDYKMIAAEGLVNQRINLGFYTQTIISTYTTKLL